MTLRMPNTPPGQPFVDTVAYDLVTHLENQQAVSLKMIDERDAKIAWLEAELDRLRAPNYESYWA